MLKIKIGDYFNLYKEGEATGRVIAISDSPDSRYQGNKCEAMSLKPPFSYFVDVDNEIECVLGNIYDD